MYTDSQPNSATGGQLTFTKVESPAAGAKVCSLARIVWTQHYSGMMDNGQIEYMLDNFQSHAAIMSQISQGYQYYLIECPDGIAGYFSFRPEADNNKMFISKLYVLKPMRGRGYFSKVLDFIQLRAKEMQITSAYLTVNKANINSISIYKKKGFEITADTITDIGNGYFMDDFLMSKTLN